MLKFFVLPVFLFPVLFLAQIHRFIYEYKFVPDSTKKSDVFKEDVRLDIFRDHSEFLSNDTAKRDSAIIKGIKQNQGEESVKINAGIYKSKVYKKNNIIYSIEYVGIQPFKIIMDSVLNWKISNETKRIANYNCQKATLRYGGRNWEAWFTSQIPIQDGPYLFSGLPGLIIELKDTKNQHSFLLVENYKVNSSETNFIQKRYFIPVIITPKEFNKKWNEFFKNPIGSTEQFMIMNPGLLSGKSFDINGNEIDNTQKKREERNYVTKQLLHNNNYIDLDLYKIN